MIFIKVNKNDDPTKAIIRARYYKPFETFKKADGTAYDPEKDTAQFETEQGGYLVNYDEYSEPKPEIQEGKISSTYFNTTTREYIFEYKDAPVQPVTDEDTKAILISLLKDSIQ